MNRLWIFLILFFFLLPFPVCAEKEPISADEVTISAYVGAGLPEHKFKLFGYTSPQAKVIITNPGMSSETTADAKGYFEFKNLFITLTKEEDLCLTAQDEQKRTTAPLCIPPIPNNQDTSIGPVIMPPTISLNSDTFFVGDKIIVTGQTIPNTDVKLSMFTDESKNKKTAFLLIQPVEAVTLPISQLKTNAKGVYSYTVSSSDPLFYRTFSQASFENIFSPKSNTLAFDILPYWIMFIKFIINFLRVLKKHLFEFVILAQLIAITIYFLRKHLHPYRIAQKHALMVRTKTPLTLSEHRLSFSQHILTRRDE